MRSSPAFRQILTVMVGAGILMTWAQAENLVAGEPTGLLHVGMGLTALGACLAVADPVSRRRDNL